MSAPVCEVSEGEKLRVAAARGLARLRGTAAYREEWGLIAARRYRARRDGCDLSYADALFCQPGFGHEPGDPLRYHERLDACTDRQVPPREDW